MVFRVILWALLNVALLAGDYSVYLNGYAEHLKDPDWGKYNEFNDGFGLEYAMKDKGDDIFPFVYYSAFTDSLRNPSRVLGFGYRKEINFGSEIFAELSAHAFAMYRMDVSPNWFFSALPTIGIGYKKVSINMTYIPETEQIRSPLLFFFAKIDIGELF